MTLKLKILAFGIMVLWIVTISITTFRLITTFRIMALSKTACSIMTLSITTFSIITLRIMTLCKFFCSFGTLTLRMRVRSMKKYADCSVACIINL
jgi:hypothetical protein